MDSDDQIEFRKENKIEASFGICHPKISVSLKDMKKAIKDVGTRILQLDL
jgi:hypothetical protein